MTTYISHTEPRKWTRVSRCLIKIKPKSDSKYCNWVSHFIFDIRPLLHNEKARFTLVIWISLGSNVTVFREPKSGTLSGQSSGFTRHSLLMRGTRIFKLAISAFHKLSRSKRDLEQNLVKMSFICTRMKNHFPISMASRLNKNSWENWVREKEQVWGVYTSYC